jgi:hypothetical protein
MLSGKSLGKRTWEDTDIDWRIILEFILEKQLVEVRNLLN